MSESPPTAPPTRVREVTADAVYLLRRGDYPEAANELHKKVNALADDYERLRGEIEGLRLAEASHIDTCEAAKADLRSDLARALQASAEWERSYRELLERLGEGIDRKSAEAGKA